MVLHPAAKSLVAGSSVHAAVMPYRRFAVLSYWGSVKPGVSWHAMPHDRPKHYCKPLAAAHPLLGNLKPIPQHSDVVTYSLCHEIIREGSRRALQYLPSMRNLGLKRPCIALIACYSYGRL